MSLWRMKYSAAQEIHGATKAQHSEQRSDTNDFPHRPAADQMQCLTRKDRAIHVVHNLNQSAHELRGNFGCRWRGGEAFLARAASSAGLRPIGFPFHPQSETASVPRRPGDGAGDGREAGIGPVLPDEAVAGEGYVVPHAPLPHQDSAMRGQS
jgi:hypothetical protein